MKKYCTQLKLLLWKNYILRKRNKLRCLVEIVWPIFMFVVLVFLHALGDRERVPNCYFLPKAMPTAGGMAFVQSALCTFGNNCNPVKNLTNPYEDSLIDKFLRKIKNETEKSPATTPSSFNFPFFKPKPAEPENETEEINENQATNEEQPSVQNYKTKKRKVSARTSKEKNFPDLTNYIPYVDSALCGPKILSIYEQFLELTKSGSKMGKLKVEYEPPEYEDDTSKYCNDIMNELESESSSRIVFRMLKPFVRGKIVYAPDSTLVAKIMEEVNESFESIRNVKDKLNETLHIFSTLLSFGTVTVRESEGTEQTEQSYDFKQELKNFMRDFEQTSENKIPFDVNEIFTSFYEKNIEYLHRAFNMTDATKYVDQVKKVLEFFDCFDPDRLIALPDEEAAVKESMEWLKTERLFALVIFNVPRSAKELPPSFTYKIRVAPDRATDTSGVYDKIYRLRVKKHPFEDLKYIIGGFAFMQNMIEGAVIRLQTGREKLPGITVQQTPYPCHVSDTFRDAIAKTLPMFMIISWVFTFIMLIKRIVTEKENYMKESMRILGVRNSQHWIAWFLDGFVPMMIISLILSLILVYGDVTPNSNIFAIWIFLMAFTIPTITLAFLMSTIFFRASYATAVSAFVFFITYLPYPPIAMHEDDLVENIKLGLCLLSNIGFGLGCTWVANMEELGEGAQFNRLNYSPVPGSNITLAVVMYIFLIDAVIYLLFAMYIENVFPGGNNVGLPFYYMFTKSYWRGYSAKRASIKPLPVESQNDPNRYEPDPEGLNVGVCVQKLTKVFGRGKRKKKAVNNLSINFYENQITSFLGHNGAGKTTSVSMMTGMLPITSGKVFMYGRDIEKDFRVLRTDIAFCKQENVLLNDLNVEEHLYLFSRLRDRPAKEAKNDTKDLINDLGLKEKRETPVSHLSGGMKRKLNIGMAFIGGPRIVFLDEPTAGVDPFARRGIWDLLVKYKSGRTIILTTHFLDEADLLGDRIAIISNGELQCCGSSLFLKSKLGSGYFLTVDVSSRSGKKGRQLITDTHDVTMSNQAKQIFELIKKTVPEVIFLEEVGSEIMYVLPAQSDVNKFESLFKSLDDNKEKLNYTSFGVTHTSLDEIFIKIIEEAEARNMQPSPKETSLTEKDEEVKAAAKSKKVQILEENPEKSEKSLGKSSTKSKVSRETILHLALTRNPCIIYLCQFFALFYVRFISHLRNFWLLGVEIVLPMVFMLIALLLGKMLPTIKPKPAITADVSAYEPSMIFYTLNNATDPQILAYEKALLGPYGLGSKCVMFPDRCSKKSISEGSLKVKSKSSSKQCSCKDRFSCPSEVKNMKPPSSKMASGDTLYNLTNQDLYSWLIANEIELSKSRYGGLNLGISSPTAGLKFMDFLELFKIESFKPTLFNIPFLLKLKDVIKDVQEKGLEAIGEFFETNFIKIINVEKAKEFFKGESGSDNINVWFNNRGLISIIAFMNGVSNLVLRASLPEGKDPSKYAIRLINHPLPGTKRQLEDQMEYQMNASLLSALSVVWALSVIPATLSLYLVHDRCSGFKHLQIVNGVSRFMYWITAFLWDYFIYSINIAIIIGLYVGLDEKAYIGEKSLKTFAALLFTYGFVSVCFTYPCTFFFETPSSCFIFITTYNIFVGLVTLLTNFALNLLTDYDDPYYIYSIFTMFHQFCFGKSLMNMAIEDVKIKALENFGMKSKLDYFEWDFTLKYIVAMIVQGSVYILVAIIIQYRLFNQIIDLRNAVKLRKMEARKKFQGLEDEEDVKREKERVESGKAKEDGDAVIIDNLSKIYLRANEPAVNHLTLGLKSGECFGLLGLNGAGKTTTFKMLTGYIIPSGGDAYIGGYSIKTSKRKAKLLLGYCPQFDALSSYLTPVEHLNFFCLLRGITGSLRKQVVNENIERLELTKHKHKMVKSLSGGNKRKVNTAIALLGDPTVVLLDEPTSGMDVRARRFLWNCILDVVQEGRCVILTTHSMEECQALCTQISIMVGGRLTCFGSCTHLKHKYNEGYSVLVRCFQTADTDKVKAHIEKSLPNSTLIQIHYVQMKFKLAPDTSVGLAFKVLNQAKINKLIQDYSISQTTLESIFLNFAKAGVVKEADSTTGCTRCWYSCKRKFKPTPS